MSESAFYQYQKPVARLFQIPANYAREKMFDRFITAVSPSATMSVLDVGVTCQERSYCNTFEKLYPYPEKITAVGLEDAAFLEKEFPGLTFVRADALNLPFADKTFDIAVSWAVIEHVGNRQRQRKLIEEMVRVSRVCFITTPNRWYPIEFHTVLPFLHWLPPETFRRLLKSMGREFFAAEETLNLLSETEFVDLLPPGIKVECLHFRLFGLVSNLILKLES